MGSSRIVWLVCSIATISIAGILATIVHQKIWSQVDQIEPGRFSPLGWYAPKIARLYSAYRLSYPGGRLVLVEYLLIALVVVGLISAASALRLV